MEKSKTHLKRRILALLMSLCIGATLFAGITVNAAGDDVWDGSSDTSWYDAGDPQTSYEFTTAEELAGLGQLVAAGTNFNGVTFTLASDIDLNYIEWAPIGTKNAFECVVFEGVVFDGGGHTIKNMKVTSNGWYNGFFGWLKKSLVKNLGIVNAEIIADGGEIGVLAGGIYESSVLQCFTTGSITLSSGIGDAVGGLVGQYYCDKSGVSDYIKECYSSVDITSSAPGQYGGLVGWASTYNGSTFSVTDCYYAGTLTISDGGSATNGIAGIAMSIIGFGFPDLPKGNYEIRNCYVSGVVENTADSTSALGIALIDGVVDNCYWNDELNIEGVMQMTWDKNNGGFIPGDDSLTTNTEEKTLDDMKSNVFANTLNNGRPTPVWGMLKGSTEHPYPLLVWQLKAFPADYSEVDTAIAAKPLDLTVYTDTSVSDLNDAINSVIRDKTADEQTTVDGYATAINAAITALVYKDADYSAVDTAISNVPDDLSIYTDDSVTVLNAAKNAVVRDKDITEQTTVDGYATAIEAAIAALVYKDANYSAVDTAIGNIPDDLTVYTDDSVAALNTAKNAVVRDKDITEQTTVDGYATAIENAIAALVYKDAVYTVVDTAISNIPADLSVYTDASVAALNAAKNAVVRGKDITEQTTVDGYATAIEAAITALVYKDAVYTAVDAAIANIPADLSVYTDTSVAALNTAKNAVVRGKDITEQTTVDGYATAINAAITALVYKDANYSAVDAAIANIPADLSVYTDDSVAALNAAKNAVVRDKNITEQTVVDGYATAIEAAINALTLDTTTLDDTIKNAEDILDNADIGNKPGQYPQDAVDELQDAIDKAKEVMDDPTATKDNIDMAKQDLLDAIEIFEDSKIPLAEPTEPKPTEPSDTDNPKTGDSSNMILWLLLGSAGLVMLVLTVKHRKRYMVK